MSFSLAPRSADGIRQILTTKISIQIGKFGVNKLLFLEDMKVGDHHGEIDFK